MIKPGSVMHRVLLALRAGEMERDQIEERLPDCSCQLSTLVRMGYVERGVEGTYRITDQGRKACPNRRDIKAEPVLNEYYFKPKAPVQGAKKENTVNEEQNVKGEKSKARLMLEHLAEHRQASNLDLMLVANTPSVKPFLKGYLERGEILQEKNGRDIFYRVADGFVTDIWFAEKKRPAKPAAQAKPEAPAIPVFPPELNASADAAEQNPHRGAAPKAPISETPAVIAAEDIKQPHESNPQGKFRVAITSDFCLLIMGLEVGTIELDPEQTKCLVNFAQLANEDAQ